MVGLKASDMDLEDLPNTNIVFLLDVSGSMSSPDKLPLLKKGFEMLVEQLTEDDRVSIVVYAGNSGVVLRGAHGDEKEEIIEAIYDLRAGGSTAGAAGIQKAYELAERYYIKNGNNRVILATDGDFNVGISSESELISFIEEKRETGIHLSVLGFGTGNLKDSKLEALADHGNGNYAYIDSVLEAKKVLVKEMYSTIYTLAKDTKIQIEFNPGMVQSYRLIGYENRRLNNRDFTDDTKDAGEIGVGHTVTAFYELIPADTTEGQKLKYSANQQSADGEWMEVRVRYKKPNQATSTELIHPVEADALSFNNSIDFNFASSVIEFGMLLQGSEYIGSASYRNVIETAKASKGLDEEGYRAQFIHLVEIAESLD
jgi:Ca-activated chloride channel family protein